MIMVISKRACDDCGSNCVPEKMLTMNDNAVITSLKCEDCKSVVLVRYEQASIEASEAFKLVLELYGFIEYRKE